MRVYHVAPAFNYPDRNTCAHVVWLVLGERIRGKKRCSFLEFIVLLCITEKSVIMANRRDRYADSDYRSPPKRRQSNYRVSDSDENDSNCDDQSLMADGYHDPSVFLKKFGGYETDEEDPVDEDEEEYESRGNLSSIRSPPLINVTLKQTSWNV
jgi:hypothetical protein